MSHVHLTPSMPPPWCQPLTLQGPLAAFNAVWYLETNVWALTVVNCYQGTEMEDMCVHTHSAEGVCHGMTTIHLCFLISEMGVVISHKLENQKNDPVIYLKNLKTD